MAISALSNSYIANLTAKNTYSANSSQQISPDKNNVDATKSLQSPSSVVTISSQAQLANIGSKYDVTNMSSREMETMAGELKNNGLINSKDYLNLTFVLTPPGATHNENAKVNYLQQFEDRLELSKRDSVNKNGHSQMLETLTNLLQSINTNIS